ncbi:MAG TPA: uroporphyrinogen-III synthase [Candidatus Eisenbacteria bacterium]|nr:uroporphyrinogen-III synthase [Candidatus Eisenbacteria bacterium]
MPSNSQTGLNGLTVFSFESRRGREIAALIRNYGGEPVVAPSMREVPLGENRAPVELFEKLEAAAVDAVILLTGVGTETMVAAAEASYSREQIAALLGKITVIARGPKPVAALKQLGLKPTLTAPEPNTYREVLAVLDARLPLAGKRVAVQEYGIANPELLDGLRARGAEVFRVPVYRWALPDDVAPLRSAIRDISGGKGDVIVFTSATQVEHVWRVAQEQQMERGFREACRRALVASIGPVCTEALGRIGLAPDLEPEHPKMGRLIGEIAERAKDLLREKRKLVEAEL